ncbi:hypothetical protein [Sporosalibacterium faouarense]|uniref:hypothetical protein n=1 Tax=Sporosalibacterium faouarense TaxID=516123 RepID=UPI00192CB5BF|nr:hypothetical protein [Sporosalibacterium faouarense]
MVIIVTILLVIILAVQSFWLVKSNRKKELIVVTIIMIINLFYSYNAFFQWEIPKPAEGIDKLYEPISQYLFNDLLKY